MRSGSGLSKKRRMRGRETTKTMCFWIKIMSPYSHNIMNLYSLRMRSLYSRRTKNLLMMSPILRMNLSSLNMLCLNMNIPTLRTMSPYCPSIARSTKNYSRLMSPMRRPRARLGPMRSNTSTFSPSKRWPTIKTPGANTAPIANSHSHSSKLKLMMNHNPTYSNLDFRLLKRIEMDKKPSNSNRIMRFLHQALNKVSIITWRM